MNRALTKTILEIALVCPLLSSVTLCVAQSVAQSNVARAPAISWQTVSPGYEVAHYDLSSPKALLRSQIVLARFDPEYFSIRAVSATELGSQRLDIQTLSNSVNAVAGINANYFDTAGNTLGLVISNGVEKQKLHRGGRALTGIFLQSKEGQFRIIQRAELGNEKPFVAVQAGPRLIVNGERVTVDSADGANRRSGIGVTKDNKVIFFATALRFPGASFADLQTMLLLPELKIADALNFDGGGSSQLFLTKAEEGGRDLLLSGGDLVPVAVTAVRK